MHVAQPRRLSRYARLVAISAGISLSVTSVGIAPAVADDDFGLTSIAASADTALESVILPTYFPLEFTVDSARAATEDCEVTIQDGTLEFSGSSLVHWVAAPRHRCDPNRSGNRGGP